MNKPNTKRKPGQPPKERQLRYPIRLHESERATWRVAAARCGMQLLDWIPEALNREAKNPIHCQPLSTDTSARDSSHILREFVGHPDTGTELELCLEPQATIARIRVGKNSILLTKEDLGWLIKHATALMTALDQPT